jgi:VIT1/CCC1 family predicted Fe2+/Mn2+ transporter
MILYFATASTSKALFASIGVTALMLVIFGYFKAKFFGCTPEQSAQSAVTTLWIGATAAGASYGIVRGIDSSHTI